MQGGLRAILAKHQMSGPRDSKRKKRGCQNEKQPVDIWVDHDDAHSFRCGLQSPAIVVM
jgi:hypothetical protein